MGILAALLGQNNPVAQWTAANHGLLSNWGAGIAQGPDLASGLANAARLGPAGQLIDQQYAKEQADKKAREDAINQSARDLQKFPDLLHAVQSRVIDPASAYSEMWKRTGQGMSAAADPADVATYKFYAKQETDAGRTPKSFADWTAGTRPGIKGSLGPPLSFIDPATKQIHPIQKFTDGSTIDLSTGQPPDPSLTYDPYSTSAAQAGGTTDATNAAVARNLLPGAEQSYGITQQALKNFDPNNMDPNAVNVRQGESENFAKVFGFIPNQMIKAIVPGTPRANFYNVINQLSGDAFLNVRQALKGAGQVTDFEGQKGEQAISRMKAAADSGDDAAFRQALAEFSAAMENGLRLLREQAQGKYAAGVVPGLAGGVPQGASGGGNKVLTYNPATGNLE